MAECAIINHCRISELIHKINHGHKMSINIDIPNPVKTRQNTSIHFVRLGGFGFVRSQKGLSVHWISGIITIHRDIESVLEYRFQNDIVK